MAYFNVAENSFGADNWCLKLRPLYQAGLLTSLSSGEVFVIDWETNKPKQRIVAHLTSINDMQVLDRDYANGFGFATANEEGTKIFDVRMKDAVASLKSEKSSPFLSVDSRHGLLACGTELSGVDAELHLYDIRKTDGPVRSMIDSHHDDITSICFHPSDPNVLMSGSTDGYVNIYDLAQPEEDDALHQVINFASIHSCGWLAPKRIFTLSHMETFGIHELNDKSDDPTEPQPRDFGDIRSDWNCDYVVDVYPGVIATGRSQAGRGELQLIPLNSEQLDTKNSVVIPAAHGDDIVRDIYFSEQNPNLMYSCGEDGYVRSWNVQQANQLQVVAQFWDYSKPLNLFQDTVIEADMNDPTSEPVGTVTEPEEKSEKDKEKPSKDKKKSNKKQKSDKDKNRLKSRFKPY
ncbi:LAMI_0E03994g1_1 [Lachancea mirantina]|uniref:LAMI_0E03994g1_1 n=1 Tax=Lachancea mirantina TaxID=1230905 RepID=A0A1G4JKQ9_9SACH|nr:LAMI_0E03994g1_1 [Lachancea mirantina]